MPVLLLPADNLTLEKALAASGAKLTVVADCYVAGVESWTPSPWGWETEANGRILRNVDHHAEDPRFFRSVSSGNLAIQYVQAEGAVTEGGVVVINHTDCDSVISAAILSGLLPPDEVYGTAVIAADHTGAPNPIADLLQALDPLRDFPFSFHSLQQLVHGQSLQAQAVDLLSERDEERRRARELVESGAFRMLGPVAVAVLSASQKVSGEFLPNLLPNATVIISASPLENGLFETKIRLGQAARSGETLYSVGIQEMEPKFRGRWNAGSTKRSGGSTTDPIALAQHVADTIRRRPRQMT